MADFLKTADSGDPADAEFLAKIAKEPGMVALPGGGQARKISDGGGRAAAGSKQVVLSLARRNLRDPASDSGHKVNKARYITDGLPPAIKEAVQLMHDGDRWEVFSPAYTLAGRTKPMPASAFNVELVESH